MSSNTSKFQKRLQLMLKDPFWSGQPFWLLNLFTFKQDEHGSTDKSRAAFREYLASAQKYTAKVFLSNDNKKYPNENAAAKAWFETARLVSVNAFCPFPMHENGYGVDAVVMFEYESPESLIQNVVGNSGYANAATARVAAEAHHVALAVKPGHLANSHKELSDYFDVNKKYHDKLWKNFLNSSISGSHKHVNTENIKPILFPKNKDMKSLLSGEAGMKLDEPFYAINLLKYKNTKEQSISQSREWNHRYHRHVNNLIESTFPSPAGMQLFATPCMSLSCEIDWDEVCIMTYDCFKSFLTLRSVPGYDNGGEYREKALLTQNLILTQPQLLNGYANGNFKVAPDGNSEGLKDPFPSVVYNSIYGGEEAKL